ncbi:hypothetical protein DFH09DRAFT_1319784 [Mycena vulgaris]|nr:hypothetical protein DFH09DRAFT_1319784 [Mycena vulgaris]
MSDSAAYSSLVFISPGVEPRLNHRMWGASGSKFGGYVKAGVSAHAEAYEHRRVRAGVESVDVGDTSVRHPCIIDVTCSHPYRSTTTLHSSMLSSPRTRGPSPKRPALSGSASFEPSPTVFSDASDTHHPVLYPGRVVRLRVHRPDHCALPRAPHGPILSIASTPRRRRPVIPRHASISTLPSLRLSSAHLTSRPYPPVSFPVIARSLRAHLLSMRTSPSRIHASVSPRARSIPFPASPHLNHPGALSFHIPPLHFRPPFASVSPRLPVLPRPRNRPRPRPFFLLLPLTSLLLPLSGRSLRPLSPLRSVFVSMSDLAIAIAIAITPRRASRPLPPHQCSAVRASRPPSIYPTLRVPSHRRTLTRPVPSLRASLPASAGASASYPPAVSPSPSPYPSPGPSNPIHAHRIPACATPRFGSPHISTQGSTFRPRKFKARRVVPARGYVVCSSGSGSNLNPDSKSRTSTSEIQVSNLNARDLKSQVSTPRVSHLQTSRASRPVLTPHQVPSLLKLARIQIPDADPPVASAGPSLDSTHSQLQIRDFLNRRPLTSCPTTQRTSIDEWFDL